MVSGTFVLPSPPAVSPALGTGECWLRRRDSRPHVSQYAGAQDLLTQSSINIGSSGIFSSRFKSGLCKFHEYMYGISILVSLSFSTL